MIKECVIVASDANADLMNSLHGERYGIDWQYGSDIMRISVLKGDPDFVRDGQNYTVTIDGVKQTHCITADAEKGVALRYKKNAIGMLCKSRGKFVTEEARGIVVIERKVA
jgi:hypothetical protein